MSIRRLRVLLRPQVQVILLVAIVGVLVAFGRRKHELDNLLPAETECVIEVHVHRMMESGAAKKHGFQTIEDNEIKKSLEKIGLDPMKDIERITCGESDKNIAVIFRGKFNPEKLMAAAKEQEKKQKDYCEVLNLQDGRQIIKLSWLGFLITGWRPRNEPEEQDKNPIYIHIIDVRTIVAGTDKQWVLDPENVAKNKGKPALNEDLAALIEAQDDKAGIWMAIPNPGKSKVFPMLWMDKVGESLADVKWFSMKLIITDEIEFTRTYGMKDKESAEKLAVALSKDFKETRNRLESIWSFRGMGFNMRKVTNVKEAANMREVAEEVANTQKIDVKDSEVVTSMKILSVSLDKLYASDKDGGKEKPTNK